MRVPAIRFETPGPVFRERDVGRSGQRDMIVVIEADQLAESQMAGERCGLGRHALHQVAITDQRISVTIDDQVPRAVVAGREIAFRDREADGIGEALPEGTGRCLHSRRQTALGVSRTLAAPLTELFELRKGQIVARQVQQAVEQDRAMAGRQDKPVPIGPPRIDRIMPKKTGPQHIGHGRRTHRQAGMAAVGFLHCIHREEANRIDAQVIQFGRRAGYCGFRFHWISLASTNGRLITPRLSDSSHGPATRRDSIMFCSFQA